MKTESHNLENIAPHLLPYTDGFKYLSVSFKMLEKNREIADIYTLLRKLNRCIHKLNNNRIYTSRMMCRT